MGHRGKLLRNSNREITPRSFASRMVNNLGISRLSNLDMMTDPRRNIEAECGYPLAITVPMYRTFYDRYALASRIVEVFPNESWSIYPELFENKRTKRTSFEKAFNSLNLEHNIWSYLHRIDVMSGIGHYGVMLLGIDDGKKLDEPVSGINPVTGEATKKNKYQLTYLRTFSEDLVQILETEKDESSPRFGQPTYYNIKFVDPLVMAGIIQPVATSKLVNRRVHWTRCIHIADNRSSSETWGVPRMMKVFNNLLDTRKILSGSAEMFWKGAFPGWAFETLPDLVEDAVLDEESLRHQWFLYQNGLQRYLALTGMRAKSLAPQVADPTKQMQAQMSIIAAQIEVPLVILLGAEAAHIEGSGNAQTWNRRLSRRQRYYLTPFVIRPIVKRFIDLGILPTPESGFYNIDWADMNLLSDKDKADVAMKKSQAIFQYATSGAEELIPITDFLTKILGFDYDTATAIVESARENKEKFTTDIWQQEQKPAMGGDPKNAKPAKSGSTGGRQPRNATSKKRGQKKVKNRFTRRPVTNLVKVKVS